MNLKTWTMAAAGATLLAAHPALAVGKDKVNALVAKVEKGDAILMDVREAAEIKDGMAAPAIWLAASEFDRKNGRYSDIMKVLPKNKQILVYCGSESCADRYVEALTKAGYQAENFGSYADWRDAGKAVRPVADAQAKPCPFLCKPAG